MLRSTHQRITLQPIIHQSAIIFSHNSSTFLPDKFPKTYLSNTSNILISILLRKSQILIQSESYIIAIESVSIDTQVQQVLLEGSCDCGFAGGGEAGEPEGEAFLLGVRLALGARETFVPGDVATHGISYMLVVLCSWHTQVRFGGQGGR